MVTRPCRSEEALGRIITIGWFLSQAAMKEKLEKHTYPKFFTAFEKLLEQHGKDYFCGPKVCPNVLPTGMPLGHGRACV